jgi:two-component system chemotaxis response regulator CheY
VSGVKAVPLEAEPAVPRLLIVDDSATTRNLVRVYLMGLGFAFLEASRADTALSMLASSKVDLVIADVNMPVMGGLAFLRAIRALPDRAKRRVPVVLLTADRSPETRARGLAAGAAGFVLKPVTSSNLREAVTMLLRQADAQKSG